MESVPNQSVGDLVSACSRLRRALAHVQCAVLDLHEAFLQRDSERRNDLERQTQAALDRIRKLSRASGRA
jgi:hypothetical protein